MLSDASDALFRIGFFQQILYLWLVISSQAIHRGFEDFPNWNMAFVRRFPQDAFSMESGRSQDMNAVFVNARAIRQDLFLEKASEFIFEYGSDIFVLITVCGKGGKFAKETPCIPAMINSFYDFMKRQRAETEPDFLVVLAARFVFGVQIFRRGVGGTLSKREYQKFVLEILRKGFGDFVKRVVECRDGEFTTCRKRHDEGVRQALEQINRNDYDVRLRTRGCKTILHVGIAFCEKSARVGFEEA